MEQVTNMEQERKLKQIIKLKLNYTAADGRAIPWELIYLMHPEDVQMDVNASNPDNDLCYQLFRDYLLVLSTSTVYQCLDNVKIEEINTINPRRDDTTSKTLTPKEQLKEHIKLQKYAMVIPLTVIKQRQSTTSSEFQKRLAYLASRSFAEGETTKKRYRSYYRYQSTSSKFPEVRMCLGNNFKAHPCATCSNFPKKVVDESACRLGSKLCLDYIMVGGKDA